MLKLKVQYLGHLMERTDSLAKTLMLGNIGKVEEKGMTEDEIVEWDHQLDGHGFEQPRELVKDREAWNAAFYGVAKIRT